MISESFNSTPLEGAMEKVRKETNIYSALQQAKMLIESNIQGAESNVVRWFENSFLQYHQDPTETLSKEDASIVWAVMQSDIPALKEKYKSHVSTVVGKITPATRWGDIVSWLRQNYQYQLGIDFEHILVAKIHTDTKGFDFDKTYDYLNSLGSQKINLPKTVLQKIFSDFFNITYDQVASEKEMLRAIIAHDKLEPILKAMDELGEGRSDFLDQYERLLGRAKKEVLSERQKYLKTLGFDVNADPGIEEIRAARQRLAKEHHPDLNKDDPDAKDRFIAINEAYEKLTGKV